MKTTNQKLALKSIALFVGLVGLTLILFSCGKAGDDNNANQHNVYPGCVNCGNIGPNGQVIFQSNSTDLNNQLSLSLSFTGAMNQYPQQYPQQYPGQYPTQYPGQYPTQYPGYGSPVTSYSGPVYAQGQMQITQGLTSYYGCVIPAGTYTVQAVQAGQWQQAMVSNLVLQANGPISLMIHINQAQVSAGTNQPGQTWSEVQPVGRLFGNISIQALNGMNCQYSNLIR